MIRLENISKRYEMGDVQVSALDGISLTVDKGEFVVVLGPSGSGKTTFLRRLVHTLLSERPPMSALPFFVPLREYGDSDSKTPAEWIVNDLDANCGFPRRNARPFVERVLRTGKALICFDGLDEVGLNELDEVRAKQQNACVRAINRFIAKHLETEIVVCSRVKDYTALNEELDINSAICIQHLSKNSFK